MISDLTRMGQWSPETTGCDWRGSTTGPIFAFEAKSFGLSISRWEYRFETVDNGCKATETWADQRGWLVKTLSPRVSGVNNRAKHNEVTMRETLEHLAAGAEAK